MLEMVIDSREAEISRYLKVKRILPFRKRRMVGPFIFMDHGGPISNMPSDPSVFDILPHPHIGISTVSYLFAGQITHRDSLGVEQIIRPGEVNWMTAGSGIAHSERFDNPSSLADGMELMQTWVALPVKDEESDPTFHNYTADQLPVFSEKGVWMRLIAGNAYGSVNEVKTNSPLCYLHIQLQQDSRFKLPEEHPEYGLYVVKGSIEFAGNNYEQGKMLIFNNPADSIILAKEPSTLMLLGGEPLGERFIWWNFVSSRRDRIEQAKEDWQQGRIKLPPNDNKEFIPLPPDKLKLADTAPKAEPLS